MGQFYELIPENIYEWILQQKMLWVATAPLSAEHHINVSPKGGEYFGLVDNKTFWYMDLTGSGSETIAHVRENGRITVMFNAFDGPPRIVRLWGYGRILERESTEFNQFISSHSIDIIPATRSIIVVDVHQVGSSCGYSVPFYEFKTFRKTLNQVFEKKEKDYNSGKSKESKDHYWAYKNAWSLDGLPAMQRGLDAGVRENVEPLTKMTGPYAPAAPFGPKSFKLSNRLRYQLAKLDTTRIQLKSVLLMMLFAFLAGMAGVLYGPRIVTSQRGVIRSLLVTNYWVVAQSLVSEIELRTIFPTPISINATSVAPLTYLTAVLKETLRLYPPVPTEGERFIISPSGQAVANTWVPHGTYCGEPFRRLLDESKQLRAGEVVGQDSLYENDEKELAQPFSVGPRNCIGQNLAWMELKLVMAKLLYNFDFELVDQETDWIRAQKTFLMWEKIPLWMNVRPVVGSG